MIRALAIVALFTSAAHAEDWPTYAHDNRRSHTTGETLTLPLKQAWVYESPNLPQTAWTGPAKWDAYAGNDGLQSMRNFDPAFFVTAVGDKVYFGSSATDAAHCLDAETGEEKWVAFADSAVRLPPTIDEGRAYFGADDGVAYCVDAETGTEIWRFNPVPDAKRIPSNNKLVSPWPIRTGVLVEDGQAYFAASLFPWKKSYLCGVDAITGEKLFVGEEDNLTLQGALLTSPEKLYAPQGRASPIVFARDSGSLIGSVPGTGGVFCILTEEEQFIAMPQNQKSKDSVTKIAKTPGTESNAVLSITGTERLRSSPENTPTSTRARTSSASTGTSRLKRRLGWRPRRRRSRRSRNRRPPRQLKRSRNSKPSCRSGRNKPPHQNSGRKNTLSPPP